MELGIFLKTFVRPSLEQAFAAVRSHGLRCIQFNFSCVGLPTLPETLDLPLLEQVRLQLDQHSLSMAAISGSCNLVHPQSSQRCAHLAKLETLIHTAPSLSCSVVTLCSGTRDANDMWHWHPENRSQAAWSDLVQGLDRLLPLAEQKSVILAIEPEPANIINDAAAARRLLDEMRSLNLRIVFDAVNLVGHSPAEQGPVLVEAMELLGADIAIAHAKDFALSDPHNTVAAGTGELDYPLYLSLLKQSGFTGPLILHGLAEAEVPAAVALLQRQIRSGRSIPAE